MGFTLKMSYDGKLIFSFNQPLLMSDELKNIDSSILYLIINGLPITNLIASDGKIKANET